MECHVRVFIIAQVPFQDFSLPFHCFQDPQMEVGALVKNEIDGLVEMHPWVNSCDVAA